MITTPAPILARIMITTTTTTTPVSSQSSSSSSSPAGSTPPPVDIILGEGNFREFKKRYRKKLKEQKL